MLKIKPLRPTLREKKRYIVYQVDSDSKIKMYNIQKDLITQLHKLLGVFHSSKSGIMPLKFDEKSKQGIIRVNHTAVDLIKSCFVMIKTIENNPVCIQTIGVSGIMKKAKEKYFSA
jgi:ribonuclease P/MRP protein subunit POP5